jgi:hypothetical protein
MDDPVRLGQEAQRLLNDPLLKRAFEGVRQKILDKLEETAIGDTATQHELTLCLQTIKQVKRHLESWVRDGQLEVDRVEKTSKWRDFMKKTGAF